MKLGVMNPVLYSMSLEKAVEYISKLGVQTIEIGVGGYPGKTHVDAKEYLDNPSKINELQELLRKNNIEISALSCHGNPVHPDKSVAKKYHDDFIDAILLAEKLQVDTIIGFSGCPGDSEHSRLPNWVTCSWPNDYLEVLDYQWNKVLIPYWKQTSAFAQQHGVSKIAFEMHPGFCVYNPSSLLRLREAVGNIIGANFDPSHLFWQGIEPAQAIKALKGAIYHFHAKDTKIDKANTAVNGVLDTGSYTDLSERSWVFRTVGYGNDYSVWKGIISALKVAGYDGAISIEHEDALMSPREGLEKAISFLKEVIIYESAGEAWWV
ncbi:MAG: sugar phosphate isomerase/epimerase [Clostridiaceae bacterium]|jgi:sugar phosphate isomerase/epimerase|nr:sugar phosphate isomerase/epimerase [Clostridiaceae bacterium]